MSKFKRFKKNEISELNHVRGGGICWETNNSEGTQTYQTHTDVWYLFEKNNHTSSGHTDTIGGGNWG